MTQRVTVLSVNGSTAKVIHNRPTACHGDCDNCAGGCGAMAAKERIIVEAENLIGARPGDVVNIEGETGKVALAIGLVYVLPLVLFFVGYFIFEQFWRVGIPAAIGGFLLGVLIAVFAGRRQRKQGREITFRIVSFVNE